MSEEAKEERTIFYSWQSDLPSGTNRGLIHDALEQAIKSLNRRAVIEDVVRLDKDTQGVPGAPEIASTIFTKIDAADVFVGDVSIVAGTSQDRHTPNPNVLMEMGYAAKSLGWDRVIPVCNTSFGALEKLPFDLRTRRVTTYELPPEGEKGPARARLKSTFEDAIGLALRATRTKVASPLEALREAFDLGKSATMHRQFLEEARRVASLVESSEFDVLKDWSREELQRRIDRYREVSNNLSRMCAFGGEFLANSESVEWIAEAIAIVAETIRITSGKSCWLDLRWLPVRMLVYSAGVAALHARNYRALAAVLLRKVNGGSGERSVLAEASYRYETAEILKELPAFNNKYTPLSNLLFEAVQPHLLEVVGSAGTCESCFDQFEYFLGLVQLHCTSLSSFVGMYRWKRTYFRAPLPTTFRQEVETRGPSWDALAVGFFEGNLQTFRQTADRLQERLDRMHWD